MHRIDNATADITDPAKPKFRDKDAQLGVVGTQLSAAFMTDAQENLVVPIELAGLVPTKGRDMDVTDAFRHLVNGADQTFSKLQIDVAGAAAEITLTQEENAHVVLDLTGARTADLIVATPAMPGFSVVLNSATGGFSVKMKVTGQSDVTAVDLPAGVQTVVVSDGVNAATPTGLITGDVLAKSGGAMTGAITGAHGLLPLSGGQMSGDVDSDGNKIRNVTLESFLASTSIVQPRLATKQWLDDTEKLDIGGTLDNGWETGNTTVTADQASGPNNENIGDLITATGGNLEHYIRERRGSIDGTYADIYTISGYFKSKVATKVLLELTADTHADGYRVSYDLAAGSIIGSTPSNQGVLIDSGIGPLTQNNWRRCWLTVDMSDVPGPVSFIAYIKILDGAGNTTFTPAGTPEDLYATMMMVNGGTLADYVPNTATSGQTFGYSIGAEDNDASKHDLTADAIINIEPAAPGEQRVLKHDLKQVAPGGWDVSVNYDHATTNLREITPKPTFTAQATGTVTTMIVEVTDSEARVRYEVLP